VIGFLSSSFPNLRKLRSLWIIFLLALGALPNASANAASLYGKVLEVNDGDTITIANLNRTVRVRLLGVDAPDGAQPYAEEARNHLAALVLHRSVTVEYSGLGQNSYLLGKVFLREADICAQMLRDGVAWFDGGGGGGRLSEADRQVYAECEKAARAERRGLWQDADPVAPWEFKQRQIARAAAPTRLLNPKGKSERKVDLTTEDLLQGLTGSRSYSIRSSNSSEEEPWRTLSPEEEHFAVQVPGEGFETSREIPAGTETATINYWVSNHEGAAYLVMWSRGPNLSYTDSSAIQEMAKGVVLGLNRGLAQKGFDVTFDAKLQRNLKLDGYAGSQFSITTDRVPGLMRAFSKQFGEQREMYIVGVINATEQTPSVEKFLKSFTLRRGAKRQP
jgi:endonuclease YncB( thermonuclease family)